MLTAIGLTLSGSSTVHTNDTQNNTINNFGWKAFWDLNTEWSK